MNTKCKCNCNSNGSITPKYISVKKLATLGLYSEQGIRAKIKRGQWVLNKHYYKMDDGRLAMDLERINRWVETGA